MDTDLVKTSWVGGGDSVVCSDVSKSNQDLISVAGKVGKVHSYIQPSYLLQSVLFNNTKWWHYRIKFVKKQDTTNKQIKDFEKHNEPII